MIHVLECAGEQPLPTVVLELQVRAGADAGAAHCVVVPCVCAWAGEGWNPLLMPACGWYVELMKDDFVAVEHMDCSLWCAAGDWASQTPSDHGLTVASVMCVTGTAQQSTGKA